MFAFLAACSLASSTPAQPVDPEPLRIDTTAALVAHVAGPARLTGYLSYFQTPMWGSRHLGVKAGPQLFLLDVDDADRAALDARVGTHVTLDGELGLELVGPRDFFSEPVGLDRDHLADPTGEHAPWDRVVFSFDVDMDGSAATGTPDVGTPDVGTSAGLDALLGREPVEVQAPLRSLLFPGGHPALVVELDGQLVGVRVVAEAASDLQALAGGEVVLRGTLAAAQPDEWLVLEPRDGQYDLEHRLGLVLQVERFERAP